MKEFEKKIYTDTTKLQEKLSEERDKKIVLTGGVFDLFHFGHLNYLQRAKELGDVLVVYVDANDSVKRPAKLGSPVAEDMKQATIISGLVFVDYVIIHKGEEYVESLLQPISPNVFVVVLHPNVTYEKRKARAKEYKKILPDMELIYLTPARLLLSDTRKSNNELSEFENDLVLLAKSASLDGHNYSDIRFGVAVSDKFFNISVGTNIGNTLSDSKTCTEKVPINNAIGDSKQPDVLVLHNNSNEIIAPCGSCRQIIYEFSDPKIPTKIILSNAKDEIYITDISKLLPMPFKIVTNKP